MLVLRARCALPFSRLHQFFLEVGERHLYVVVQLLEVRRLRDHVARVREREYIDDPR